MVKKINPQIKKLEERISELENSWKRALADYENLQKRSARERTVFLAFAQAQLLDKFLGALDDLECSEFHLKDKGLTLGCDHFREVLKSEGVEKIKVENQVFDPEAMDALELVSGPKNKVMEVVLKGYRLGDKVLRPAKVKVGKGDRR